MGRDARRTAFQLVDGNGEGRTEHRGVVFHLMGQFQFLASFNGDRCTEHTACIFQHEIHLLGSNLLGGDNQVALVFAVFVVDHNNKLAFLEVLDGLFYVVQS